MAFDKKNMSLLGRKCRFSVITIVRLVSRVGWTPKKRQLSILN